MDDRSLRALLEKGEREASGAPRGAAGFWAAAALVLTAVGGYLGTILSQADPAAPGPRRLAYGLGVVFGLLALYCWIRLLGAASGGGRAP